MGASLSLSGKTIKAPGEIVAAQTFKSDKPYKLIFNINVDLRIVPGSTITITIDNDKQKAHSVIEFSGSYINTGPKIDTIFTGDTKVTIQVKVPKQKTYNIFDTLKIKELSVGQVNASGDSKVSTVSKFGETCNSHSFLIFMLLLIIALMAYVFYTNKSVINLPRNPFNRQLAAFGRSMKSIKRIR